MRLLLDTNILIPMVDGTGRDLPPRILDTVRSEEAVLWASVASIWEVAIKHRLGKLPLPCALDDWPAALTALNIRTLPVRTAHIVRNADPPTPVRDPFDRLLLAICAAEHMQLVTLDRKLRDHPLASQPPA